METKRQINIEVLRVFSMLLIILGHYFIFGLDCRLSQSGYDICTFEGCVNYFTLEPLFILCCIGTNVFVMISGYFLSAKEELRWKGILKTWIQTFFYTMVIGGIFFYINRSFSLSYLAISFMPVHCLSYWFVTSYVGLLLISPFLAMISNRLNRRQYLILLCVGFIMCFQFLYGDIYAGGHHIGWFIYLFFVAGYIKKFSVPLFVIKHRWVISGSIIFLLFLIATLVNAYSFYKTGLSFKLRGSNNHGMAFFLSVAIFVIFVFSDYKGKIPRVLSKLSPYCFGVYLIHMNPFYFRDMWSMIIPNTYNFPIVFHALITCIVIFILCSVIDMLRQKVFDVLCINDFISKMCSKFPQL